MPGMKWYHAWANKNGLTGLTPNTSDTLARLALRSEIDEGVVVQIPLEPQEVTALQAMTPLEALRWVAARPARIVTNEPVWSALCQMRSPASTSK